MITGPLFCLRLLISVTVKPANTLPTTASVWPEGPAARMKIEQDGYTGYHHGNAEDAGHADAFLVDQKGTYG